MSSALEQARTCPINEIVPMSPDMLKCPHIMNRRFHKEAPVFQDPLTGIFFVSRYDDVVAMSLDHGTFSSVMPGSAAGTGSVVSDDAEIKAIMEKGYPAVSTMLTADPPLQRHYRKFVNGAFSPESLRKLEPFIEQVSNELVDGFIDEGHCEFLGAFGVPLPLTVIASQIGVPLGDLPLLRKWTMAFIGNLSQQLDRDGLLQAARDVLEFQLYFVDKMEDRRKHAEDDILSALVGASIDGEQPLNNAECLSMLSQILVAGNETTSAALTEAMVLLIDNPDQYELVRNDPSPEMIHRLVEEVLRYTSPSSNMFRRTTRDVEVNGVTIPENSVCFARFAAANQDDERFPDAMRFDIMRPNLKDHVAFGKGVHHCLGAALSRREMNGGFKVIFERLENFRLTPDSPAPEFSANALLHGMTGLELSFDKI